MTKSEEMVKSWLRLCNDPRTSIELLENAAYWESINQPQDYHIRLAVARHRSAPAELLTKLSMVNYLPLQIAVAGHSNLSEVTAGKLMKTHLRELRRALASNTKIPLYVMEKLSRDFADVRARLAKNPNITKAIMKRFALQKDKSVRMALAQNRNLHLSFLELLSKDKEADIRAMVVHHPKVPLSGLRNLALDKSSKVREAVLERGTDEFPGDRALFEALAKTKPSVIAQRAEEQLEILDRRDHASKILEQAEGSSE